MNEGTLDMDAATSGFIKGSMVAGIGGMVSAGAATLAISSVAGTAVSIQGIGMTTLIPVLAACGPLGWAALGVGGISAGISIFAAAKGYKSVREKKLQQALSRLDIGLKETANSAIKAISRSFQELSTSLDRHARDALENLSKGTQS